MNYWVFLPLLSLVLTILMYHGRICDDWGCTTVLVLSEKWERDTASQSRSGFLFFFIFSMVNFLLLWIYCLFGAFALTHWLIVCIRYHRSISVSAWGCIDTRIIDPGIRVGDPEGSSVAESRSSCFWTAAWSVTSSLTPAGWSRVG